jgi:endo-1,3(4)-beta-glucanase
MLLSDQNLPVWTHPYSVWFSKDSGYEGLAMHHVPKSDRVFGPDANTNPVQYFYGPNGIKSLVFSSTDFNSNVTMGLENINHMSADCKIYSQSQGYILAPLVQGQGFVTAIYYNLIPQLKSIVGFSAVIGDTSPRSGINKYKITLNNNRTWTLYITIPGGQSLQLAKKDDNTIVGNQAVNGAVFQLVAGNSSAFDEAAGMYPTRGTLSGSISGTTGSYSISYSTAGASNNGTTAMFALPHHVETFTNAMSGSKTSVTLDTVTKGTATLYLTNKFEFQLTVPTNIGLDPYSSISGTSLSWSDNVKSAISTAAEGEIAADVVSESNLDSMYGAGKILAKYAWLLYVTHYVLKDTSKTNTLLPKLKTAIERFSKNTQQFPLTYDQTWKGIISTARSSADYGNSYYNDHHFHYGYHVMAAAITAKVDAELGGYWLWSIKDWVNNLARDFSSPSDNDPYFPAFRSFDWYNGHSWAKGIFASGDGKDQESTSEDYNAYYALKIWGSVIGDSCLEQRSTLQLGVMTKSINSYFLLADNNTIQPSRFIKNKVTGIFFENKVDHTTYFGTNLEYIQMIHAIPVTSFSSFVRTPTFTREEWDQKLSSIVGNVNDGWKGIIMLNVALFDPKTSYNFFNGSSFSNKYLDNGQSKSWSLAYSGGFANV